MARIKTYRVLARRMDADAAQVGRETIADLTTGHYGELVPTHRQLYRREVGKPGAVSERVVLGRVRAEVRRRAENMAYDVLDDVSSTLSGSSGGTLTFGYIANRIENDANDMIKGAM